MILEGRGFRGGSDEKMLRMWLGLEIVVAGLPPLVEPFKHFHGYKQTIQTENKQPHKQAKYI